MFSSQRSRNLALISSVCFFSMMAFLSSSVVAQKRPTLVRGAAVIQSAPLPPTPAQVDAGDLHGVTVREEHVISKTSGIPDAGAGMEPSTPIVEAPVRLGPSSTITCAGAGGNWSSNGTWTGGVVPAATDDVVIPNGCTVTIDTAAAALSVDVKGGGTLVYDATTARSLAVAADITVEFNGTFQTAASGAVTTHTLSLAGNLTNSGTFNFSTNANSAGGDITFTGASNTSFSGSGATTNIRTLTVNKGSSSSSVLDLSTSNFTVQGSSSPAGFLTLINGTFKVSGGFALTSPFFTLAAYTIPSTGGFWLNSATVTVAGQNGSSTNNGLLRVSSGIFNAGIVGINVVGAGTGAVFAVDGGFFNVAGRLTSASAVSYTQSGGTVNICTAGGCATSPSFGFTSTLPTNSFNMSGGAINIVNSNTLTTADWNQQGLVNYSAGTVNFGTAATATNFNFRAQGNLPSVVIDTTTNNKTLLLTSTSYVYGNFTIPTGATFNPNSNIADLFGPTFTNNGTVSGCLSTAATSRLQFVGSVAQAYTGSGTVCSAADPLFGFAFINRGGGLTIDPTSPAINAARLLAFSGSLTNANKINLAVVGTNVMVIQRGGVATFAAGTIDVAPTIAAPTSLILVYSQASNAVTTGAEVPPGRTVLSLQDFNTNGITLAGGPLTVLGNGGAAPDTTGLFLGGTTAGTAGGPLITSAANLLTVAGTATVALAGGSGMSYIQGPLARTLPANLVSGSTYPFPIGKSQYKAFELVNPTINAGGTVTVQAEVFDTGSGGTNGGGLDAVNTNRYWSAQIISGAGNFTAGTVRVTELNSAGNQLGQSATQGGAYASAGGTLTASTVASAALASPVGFFAVGRATGTATFAGGTFTIGPAGSYLSLTAAMADLNGKIITGPVTYSLLSTYTSAGETFPIVVPANGGSNATNTITIKPAAGASPTISGSSANAILELAGADYVTIDGSNAAGGSSRDLSIQNTSAVTTTAAVWLASQGSNAGATFNTIKNTNIHAGLAGATTNIFGIFVGGAAVGTNGDDNDFLTITNNTVDTAYEGIAVRAVTVLNGENDGLSITANKIGNVTTANSVTFRGIELIGAGYATISNNEVLNMQTTTISSNIAAIELGSTVYYARAIGNKLHDIDNENTGQWGAYGMYDSTSTNNFGNSIISNAIWNVTNYGFTSLSFSAVGLRYVGGAGGKIYFNSVNMVGTQTLATGISAAFSTEGATASGLDVRDNIFVNRITGGVKQYAAYATTATAFGTSANLGLGTVNYNDYYSTGTGNVANFLNFFGADHTSLTAFRNSTQGDQNSISADPLFVSMTNLDLQSGSPAIGAGQTIAGVSNDTVGRTRLNPPSIGAYEPLGTTAAAVSVTGRVLTSSGQGIRGAYVVMTDEHGVTRTALTSAFGYYSFTDVASGQQYSMAVSSRRYSFRPRALSVVDALAEVDFIASP
ncbi:MAG: beta strand repeat-containing protein [Pyrinomonadaceae bacterium]